MFGKRLKDLGLGSAAFQRLAKFNKQSARTAALPVELHQYIADAVLADDVNYVSELIEQGADVEEIYGVAYDNNAENVLSYLDKQISVQSRRRIIKSRRRLANDPDEAARIRKNIEEGESELGDEGVQELLRDEHMKPYTYDPDMNERS